MSSVSSAKLVAYRDVRQSGKPLHTYTESHANDITSLAFLPSSDTFKYLLSGSTDGLFTIFDCNIADEDDAVIGVANLDTSIKSLGWISTLEGGLVALSDMGTVELWNILSDGVKFLPPYLRFKISYNDLQPERRLDFGDLRTLDLTLPDWTTDYVLSVQPITGTKRSSGVDIFLCDER